jgi:hypothetical protein
MKRSGADVSWRVGFCDAKGQDAKTVNALKFFSSFFF